MDGIVIGVAVALAFAAGLGVGFWVRARISARRRATAGRRPRTLQQPFILANREWLPSSAPDAGALKTLADKSPPLQTD